MGDEYPKCIYRDGGPDDVWGVAMTVESVASAAEEREALAMGWRLHPLADLVAEERSSEPRRGPGRPRKILEA